MNRRTKSKLETARDHIETARSAIESLCESETMKDEELEALGDAQEACQAALDKIIAFVPFEE